MGRTPTARRMASSTASTDLRRVPPASAGLIAPSRWCAAIGARRTARPRGRVQQIGVAAHPVRGESPPVLLAALERRTHKPDPMHVPFQGHRDAGDGRPEVSRSGDQGVEVGRQGSAVHPSSFDPSAGRLRNGRRQRSEIRAVRHPLTGRTVYPQSDVSHAQIMAHGGVGRYQPGGLGQPPEQILQGSYTGLHDPRDVGVDAGLGLGL